MPEKNVTMSKHVVIPQVMTPMIRAKLPKKIKFSPFAHIDRTLEGNAGDTITVPQYMYIGDADKCGEGEKPEASLLSTTQTSFTIDKYKKIVKITEESRLKGHGDPYDEAATQLTESLGGGIDRDCYAVIANYKDNQRKFVGEEIISYNTIVDAVDVFNEEDSTTKVMFINPKQLTQLRKDPNFIDRSKYGNQVMLDGEVGMVADVRIVRSNRVRTNEQITAMYALLFEEPEDWAEKYNTSYYVKNGPDTYKTIDVGSGAPKFEAGVYYEKVSDALVKGTYWLNPILVMPENTDEPDTDDGSENIHKYPLSIILKRDATVKYDEDIETDVETITANEYGGVALTNVSAACLALIRKAPAEVLSPAAAVAEAETEPTAKK